MRAWGMRYVDLENEVCGPWGMRYVDLENEVCGPGE